MLDDLLTAPERQHEEPIAARGRINRAPATADDSLTVTLLNFGKNYEFEVPAPNWMASGGLPEPGAPCLVVFDDDGDAWVPVWLNAVPSGGTEVPPAAQDTLGTVELSTAPTDPLHPVVVTDEDPRNANARPPTAHVHAEADVTNLVADLAGKAPTVHAHAEADVTGLVADLAAKEVQAAKGVANGYAPLDSGILVPVANLPDATGAAKGIVRLTGDLGGTAAAPTVPGLAAKEATANKGAANGYAPLDAQANLPAANLPDPEAWHLVGTAGEPAFANGWTNLGTGNDRLAFYKDPTGIVHMRGLVHNGPIGSGIFTLPVGYRPDGYRRFPVASAGAYGQVDVQSTGVVSIPKGSNTDVDFAPVQFRAA